MDDKRTDRAAVVDAMAALMRLAIAPEWRPGVVAGLETAAAMAELLLEAPPGDDVAPAAIAEVGR